MKNFLNTTAGLPSATGLPRADAFTSTAAAPAEIKKLLHPTDARYLVGTGPFPCRVVPFEKAGGPF